MILSDNEPLADWAPSSVLVKQKRSEALFSKHEETELDPSDFIGFRWPNEQRGRS